MKSIPLLLVLIFFSSCGKENVAQSLAFEENNSVPPYDTVAIDSFSQGATSIDIARKIEMSSFKFQDSLKQVKLKIEEEQLLKKEKDEKASAEKKAEEIKKRTDAEPKKAKDKAEIAKTEKALNQ
ncbi:hypothetical protein FNJ88_07250 [Chryseobacterium sp. SNU WT5]|uniref:hypothetical protein n=1 Tax=Chryseobacterium sp. SNU WT5 TaxID=2594269 RepID=UPI00117E3BC4|nr:hypothetical protein [Chryseobacterium sp. SNU WT5]QDP85368.1 hypothetical protein FNJ88_07250 [Chryseobacterium sp. SNU WT5]